MIDMPNVTKMTPGAAGKSLAGEQPGFGLNGYIVSHLIDLDDETRDVPGAPKGAPDAVGEALVAKQPVFDLEGRIWGYELLFRDPSLKPGLGNKSSQAATSTVMVDGFSLMRPLLRPEQKFLINFTAEFLESDLPLMLPPDICVIEILETVKPTKAVLQGLSNLKQQGYTLALDDYTGQESLQAFLPLVDIVKVDVLELDKPAIGKIVLSLMLYGVVLLAEKVEDREMASFCRAQGFHLFQGFFYSKAEIVRGTKLNPSQLTNARLLSLAADKGADLRRIREVIVSDVVLVYRLLKYINSVFFGLPVKVRNMDHAVLLLGEKKLKQWLHVTALAGLGNTSMSLEIVYISAQRAKFLELLAEACPGNDRELAPKLFLVGLFSLLESLMRTPADDIFAQLSLDPDVKDALAGGKGPLGSWYAIMIAYERGQWEELVRLAEAEGISSAQLKRSYVAAGQWATLIFTCSNPFTAG